MSKKYFFREALTTLALVYSIMIALFFVPYLIFVNRAINFNLIMLYLIILCAYLVFWLIDKEEFIKNEINY